jgi:hypothetical protein
MDLGVAAPVVSEHHFSAMAGGSLRYKGGDDRPHRKKRRRESPSVAEEALAPERPPPRSSKPRLDTYVFDDDDYAEDDELPSAASRAAAEARLRAEEDARVAQDEFQARLFEEMREDEGADRFEGLYAPPAAAHHLPNRWRAETNSNYYPGGGRERVSTQRLVDPLTGVVVNAHVFDLKDAMDDEAYAEHIRTGMYRRTHAEEIRRAEEADAARKARERKLAAELKAAQRAEADRIRAAERDTKAAEAEAVKARRAAYDAAWTRLVSLPADQPLRPLDFPWPVGPGDAMDAKSISRFLLGHLGPEDDDKARRRALRAPVMAYHPDRIARLVDRIPEAKGERQTVRELALRVSQLLNDLLASL